MNGTLKVWLWRPHESCAAPVHSLLERAEMGFIEVGHLDDVLAQIEQGGASCELMVLPSRLESGDTPVQVAVNIKSHELCHTLPLVFLRAERDIASTTTLIGAGVDFILSVSQDSDVVAGNLQSLVRYRRNLAEREAALAKSGGLRRSVLDALQSVREGIVLLNREYEILFINAAARRMLELGDIPDSEFPATLVQQLEGLARFHCETVSSTAPTGAEELERSVHETSLARLDGRLIRLCVHGSTLRGAQGEDSGYAFALTDLNELAHLEHARGQARRQRFVALLCCATAISLLPQASRSTAGPLVAFESELTASPSEADAVIVLTQLLEVIDQALLPGVSIKVAAPAQLMLNCRRGHLFELCGEIILAAVDAAGAKGEVHITLSPNAGVTLFRVVARVNSDLSDPGSDPLAQLIRGQPRDSFGQADISGLLPTAANLVSRYQGSLVNKSDIALFHVEVFLPC